MQPHTDDAETDISSATAVGFIENPPLDKRVLEDLHGWVSLEAFQGCESLFRYHLSDAEYGRFSVEFLAKKEQFKGQSRLQVSPLRFAKQSEQLTRRLFRGAGCTAHSQAWLCYWRRTE